MAAFTADAFLPSGEGILVRLLAIWGFLWWLVGGVMWLLFRASIASKVLPFSDMASTTRASARLLARRDVPDPMHCLVCQAEVRCLFRSVAARCRAAAYCRADCR
ncbi:hypothetical protein V6N13_032102 [Hibiscus sabdariffa]